MTKTRHLPDAWNIYFSQRQNPSWAFRMITKVEQHWIIQKLKKKLKVSLHVAESLRNACFNIKKNRKCSRSNCIVSQHTHNHCHMFSNFRSFGWMNLRRLVVDVGRVCFFIRIKYYTLTSPEYRTRTFGVCAPKWMLCDVQNRKAFWDEHEKKNERKS